MTNVPTFMKAWILGSGWMLRSFSRRRSSSSSAAINIWQHGQAVEDSGVLRSLQCDTRVEAPQAPRLQMQSATWPGADALAPCREVESFPHSQLWQVVVLLCNGREGR